MGRRGRYGARPKFRAWVGWRQVSRILGNWWGKGGIFERPEGKLPVLFNHRQDRFMIFFCDFFCCIEGSLWTIILLNGLGVPGRRYNLGEYHQGFSLYGLWEML